VRTLYTLQGRTIAQQESTPGAIYGPQGRIFLLGDHLGSVSVVTDTNGQVVSRQDSTPWGEARGSDITQTTLNFTGQRKDGTGLLYYGARYYDPVLGRFVSPDSLGAKQPIPQSLNHYSYVLNNPLKFTDPTGHEERAEGGGCDVSGGRLDCQVADFQNASYEDRLAWLQAVSQKYKLNDWFNVFGDILKYFRDSPTFNQSAKMSLADAGVIWSLQEGVAAAQGLREAGNSAGRLWQTFIGDLRKWQNAGSDEESDLLWTLRREWGEAEQGGVDYGIALAENIPFANDSEKTLWDTFLFIGNQYRSSLRQGSPFIGNFWRASDPRRDGGNLYDSSDHGLFYNYALFVESEVYAGDCRGCAP